MKCIECHQSSSVDDSLLRAGLLLLLCLYRLQNKAAQSPLNLLPAIQYRKKLMALKLKGRGRDLECVHSVYTRGIIQKLHRNEISTLNVQVSLFSILHKSDLYYFDNFWISCVSKSILIVKVKAAVNRNSQGIAIRKFPVERANSVPFTEGGKNSIASLYEHRYTSDELFFKQWNV